MSEAQSHLLHPVALDDPRGLHIPYEYIPRSWTFEKTVKLKPDEENSFAQNLPPIVPKYPITTLIR